MTLYDLHICYEADRQHASEEERGGGGVGVLTTNSERVCVGGEGACSEGMRP